MTISYWSFHGCWIKKGRSILLVERIKTSQICQISIHHRHPSSLWNRCILVEHMGLMLHCCNSPWPSCCAECPAVLCLGTGILPREFWQIEASMAWMGKDNWSAGCIIPAHCLYDSQYRHFGLVPHHPASFLRCSTESTYHLRVLDIFFGTVLGTVLGTALGTVPVTSLSTYLPKDNTDIWLGIHIGIPTWIHSLFT